LTDIKIYDKIFPQAFIVTVFVYTSNYNNCQQNNTKNHRIIHIRKFRLDFLYLVDV